MFSATQFKLIIPSVPENIRLIEPYVRRVQTAYRLDDTVFFNVLVVLTEAVNNCIIHGNRRDPEKSVTVELVRKPNKLSFFIADEGSGFDPKILPDPTTPSNRVNPSGRGVFLMQQLSSKIEFTNLGRKVCVEFNI